MLIYIKALIRNLNPNDQFLAILGYYVRLEKDRDIITKLNFFYLLEDIL